jgi:hypothetical protein
MMGTSRTTIRGNKELQRAESWKSGWRYTMERLKVTDI